MNSSKPRSITPNLSRICILTLPSERRPARGGNRTDQKEAGSSKSIEAREDKELRNEPDRDEGVQPSTSEPKRDDEGSGGSFFRFLGFMVEHRSSGPENQSSLCFSLSTFSL
uniref:Uncharacterized protein n=1 Tax=Opuntia streptacantha TaxID=393608 RepID=A0A7C8Z3M9_OPUST